MNKTEYLALPEVAQFTEFLRSRLLSDDVQFAHAYEWILEVSQMLQEILDEADG